MILKGGGKTCSSIVQVNVSIYKGKRNNMHREGSKKWSFHIQAKLIVHIIGGSGPVILCCRLDSR